MIDKSALSGGIRKECRGAGAVAVEVDTQAVAWVLRPWVERRGMVGQSLTEEAEKLRDGKRRRGGGGHFFCHGLKMLKRVCDLGTLGVVEIHIGQEMDPGLEPLHPDGLLSRVDDIGRLSINQEKIEGVVAIGRLALHGRGRLGGGCRLKSVEAQQSPRAPTWVSRLRRVPVQHARHKPMLVDTQPGSSGHEILPTKNPGAVLEYDRGGGGTIQKFIPVCRDHERVVWKGLKVQGERAHGARQYRLGGGSWQGGRGGFALCFSHPCDRVCRHAATEEEECSNLLMTLF